MSIYDTLFKVLYPKAAASQAANLSGPPPSFTGYSPNLQSSVQQTLTGSPVSSQPSGPSAYLGSPTGQVKGASTTYNPPAAQTPQNPSNPFQGQGDAAAQQAQAELQSALDQYDYTNSQLNTQKDYLGGQYNQATGQINSALSQAQTAGATQKTTAAEEAQSAKNKALSTAQDVTKQNRNILRALGILSSSAAGSMLTKPMTEYGTQAADLEQQLIKRNSVVDDWLNQRMTEHQQAVDQLTNQYQMLLGNIQNDQRFNDRQKLTAVQAAQAALSQRISDINTSAVSYQNAANTQQQNFAAQIAQIKAYQNPSADITGILSSLIQPQQNYQPVNATIYNEDLKKRLSGQAY